MTGTVSDAPSLGASVSGTMFRDISFRAYLIVVAQLGLVLLLLRQFQIESAAFIRVAALTFGGFAVHALLPARLRLPFFALLSAGAIVVALGIVHSAWLIALGLLLIGICHLPLSFRVRVGLLSVLGATLVAQRAGHLPAPWPQAIWPILGSMFMFRLLVYLYDLKHEKTSGTWWERLAYFFMLPNACFPLFPVVDYKAFRTTRFADDAYLTYQKGIDWIVRGVIHLLLYRIFYYHLSLAPHEVVTPADLSQYLISNFMLYLRVSGLFHLIVGMLHLFGFGLPETHNRYLLASSFTDFWRRINIYWKDFMQKLFYYPAVFALRRLGTVKALVIATIYVFLMTWFLHAYQWFWLRGTMLLVWQDVLFWAILGLLVVINSLVEIRYGRKRTLRPQQRSWTSVSAKVFKTYATFCFIVVLWSFWTAESLEQWAALWKALGGPYNLDALVFPAIALGVIAVGSIPAAEMRNVPGSMQSRGMHLRDQAVSVLALVLLVGVSIERISTSIGPEFGTFVHSLRSGQLSRIDTAKLERGYYENLLSVDRFNSQLWEVYTKKPANWLDVEHANLKRFVSGFQRNELIPSFVSHSKYGTITINSQGMRDQEYAALPSRGTHRAVMMGPSSVMGWGVADGQTFEALVEKRLNESAVSHDIRAFEILNMGVPGYDPPQQLILLDKALSLRPNAIYLVSTGRELTRSARNLVTARREGLEVPFPELQGLLVSSGVAPGDDESSAMRKVSPHGERILEIVYGTFARKVRATGAVPVWIYLPPVQGEASDAERSTALRIARAAGFVVIDMENVFAGRAVDSLRLAEWDNHPNASAHALFAERLVSELLSRKDELFDASDRPDAFVDAKPTKETSNERE